MQTQFQHIIDLAKLYKSYSDDSDVLYKALNELPRNVIEDILNEYGDPEKSFQHVNLLRAEVARQLLDGKQVKEVIVEEIKEKIRARDLSYFNHLNPSFLEEIKSYKFTERDMFANWQKPWSIFHTFFYRLKWGNEKETVQTYLEQICNDLISKLELSDYTYHWVDFQGAANFGSDYCWIALYPLIKYSHKDAYQFFFSLSAAPEAGRFAGHKLKNSLNNLLKSVSNYEEGLKYLEELKPEIIKLNNESKNYFKFAPGRQAIKWEEFYSNNFIGIDFSTLKVEDLNKYTSKEEIKEFIGFCLS